MQALLKLTLIALVFLAGCSDAPPAVGPNSRVDHVAISVANAKASADFYRGAFGFSELKTPFGPNADVVWLDLGGGVALHVFGGRISGVQNEHERHIAFAVADLSRVTSFLKSRGMSWQNFDGVQDEVQTRPDGIHQLFFRDPDGYWVEVNDALKAAAR